MRQSRACAETKVTVLLPAYNAGSYLRPAVDSVLEQTFQDLELLIIDDGSNDHSLETVEPERDARIRLLSNPTNLGLIATLNRGVSLAQGEYLARMDADDLCEPERLERQVNYLDSHPEVGICSTWATCIDAEGRELGVMKMATGRCLQRLFWKPSPLIHPAMMGRTSLLQAYPYDPDYPDAEDYELLLRLYDVTVMHNLPEPLYRLRRHGENISIMKRDSQLASSYRAFCRFVGSKTFSFEVFLALACVNFSMNPLRRFWFTLRASRRTGVNFGCLIRDNWQYFRHT